MNITEEAIPTIMMWVAITAMVVGAYVTLYLK